MYRVIEETPALRRCFPVQRWFTGNVYFTCSFRYWIRLMEGTYAAPDSAKHVIHLIIPISALLRLQNYQTGAGN